MEYILSKKEIKIFDFKNKIELEQNKRRYLSEIIEIKKKYEEEIKKTKKKYYDYNNNINNKYKLKNEKGKIKYNLKIEKLNFLYENKINEIKYETRTEEIDNIIKINENILNIYNLYNNNYFNAININNILFNYIKNKSNNEIMQKILGNDYDKVINIIKYKYKEGINILDKENEINELKNKIKEEINKSKELSDMNIELNIKNEKNEEEKSILNQHIKEIEEKLDKIKKDNQLNLENINELKALNEEKEIECNQIKNKLNKYQKYFGEEIEELEKYQLQNSNINFEKYPYDIEYEKQLVKDRRNSGLLYNIAVYVGLNDNEGYLVYQDMSFNLTVMRIRDEEKIKSLIGHKNGIALIRYYHNKNNKTKNEEYILSCDKLLIVWDINDNFSKKYTLLENYQEKIFDSLLLFNLFNKDYILLSSDNQHDYNEYSKLYEFKENTPFVKNIYNTNKNKNAFLIPWLYKNKYYLIACCDYEISINNIFEDESYANLKQNPEGGHYNGFLYNDNYLCVSDMNNNFIRIWNLVKKNIYKTINFSAKVGYEMTQYNDEYTIIGCDGYLIIINIEEGEEYKKIKSNNGYIHGLKKIKINNLGECIISSEDNNIINIYKIIKQPPILKGKMKKKKFKD